MSSTHETKEKCIKTYLGKHEGKQPFGRRKNWWEDNVKIGVEKIVQEGVDWHLQACDRDQ